jgi:hypothetical protein
MRPTTLALVLAATGLCAGCATHRATDADAPPSPEPRISHAGRWEVVLPGMHVSAAAGDEESRRDEALALRAPETIMDQTLWPPAQAPHLDDLRGRFISDDPRVINYYSNYGGGYSWWYGGWRWR